ncbi:hypothetical protein PMAYCL1PPCAC_01210, partial [Pristionchus mayeri]
RRDHNASLIGLEFRFTHATASSSSSPSSDRRRYGLRGTGANLMPTMMKKSSVETCGGYDSQSIQSFVDKISISPAHHNWKVASPNSLSSRMIIAIGRTIMKTFLSLSVRKFLKKV